MPYWFVVKEAAKYYGKRRAKKWAKKQAKKKGGRKLFPPTLGGPLGGFKGKSKRGPGVAIKRPGRPKSRKTMRARSAPKSKPKMVRYRKGGCPPGYRYDPRRKMCIQNIYK